MAPDPARPADVVLVGCVKTKLAHGAPSRELYVSDYFAKMRSYAEATGLPWFILSAEHGLVAPDQWLDPYERYLPDTSREYRRSWGLRVASALEQELGPLAGVVFDIHAGKAYVESVGEALSQRGALVLDLLEGLSFGRRLSWYLQHGAAGSSCRSNLTARLQDGESALTVSELLARGGTGLRVAGLYGWWVDDAGAEDLRLGLGVPVRPGLVYVGQAGATRRSGGTSSSTLWGRVTGMHLGRNRGLSTLRHSLWAILAEAYGPTRIDEELVTRWMYAHLRIVTVPVPDADGLGALESQVLVELDPPLNLAGMSTTPLRMRLTALRKKWGSGALDEQYAP